jgi:hypothetical protein
VEQEEPRTQALRAMFRLRLCFPLLAAGQVVAQQRTAAAAGPAVAVAVSVPQRQEAPPLWVREVPAVTQGLGPAAREQAAAVSLLLVVLFLPRLVSPPVREATGLMLPHLGCR